MPRTELTADLLFGFEKNIKNESDRFRSIEKEMNNLLHGGFLFDDPVAHRFRARYTEGLKPLHAKLLPAMEKYQVYLHRLGEDAIEWAQN